MKGKLYLVPSPIGEMSDLSQISPQALEALTVCNHFIAERAKTARAFLKAAGKNLGECVVVEWNKHGNNDTATLLEPVLAGASAAFLSEAGAPAVADPGAALVLTAHQQGILVVPTAGPSAILLALMASGLQGQRFTFCGYLPKDDRELVKAIAQLERRSAADGATQIFIETPYRNQRLWKLLLETLQPETFLGVSAGLATAQPFVLTLPVSQWWQRKAAIDSLPAVFLVYRNKLA